MGAVTTMIGNATTIICFTILSIHFENPWLVLMAIFFYRNYTETPTNTEKKDENNG